MSLLSNAARQVSQRKSRYPFFIKAPLIVIGLYLFFYILFLLQDILMPFAYAGLIAILLNPVYNRFLKWKMNKIVAILLTILLAVAVVAGVMYFLSSQIAQFGEMLPQLKEKILNRHTSSTQRRAGSLANSRTIFINDLNPFSGDMR